MHLELEVPLQRNYHSFIYLYFLQAAGYGLPVVATRNGGPVDIIKVKSERIYICSVAKNAKSTKSG